MRLIWATLLLLAFIASVSVNAIGGGSHHAKDKPGATPAASASPSPSASPGVLQVQGTLLLTTPTPGASPRPSPTATSSSAPMTVFRYPTAFVIAFAADAPTNAKIAVEVARQLAKSGGLRNNWIASAPANWQLSDFFNQCQSDLTNAQTLGAFIVYNASTETGNRSYILLGRGWSKLDADVMFVSCPHWKTGNPAAYQMQVSWLSNGVMGDGTRASRFFLSRRWVRGSSRLIRAEIRPHRKPTRTSSRCPARYQALCQARRLRESSRAAWSAQTRWRTER